MVVGQAGCLISRFENCFSDVDNFTMTQENYSMPPAVVNYCWANRQQLTVAGAIGS